MGNPRRSLPLAAPTGQAGRTLSGCLLFKPFVDSSQADERAVRARGIVRTIGIELAEGCVRRLDQGLRGNASGMFARACAAVSEYPGYIVIEKCHIEYMEQNDVI